MKKYIYILLMTMGFQLLFGNEKNETLRFDFIMQDIKDIVYAVSIAQNIPIVCDDTIEGKTSFRFSGTDFEQAGVAFLRANRLYAKMQDDVIVLSKVNVEALHGNLEKYSINAYDVRPSVFFNKLSEISHIPISYELLPTTPISLHVKNVKIEEAVSIVMRSFPDYVVNLENNGIGISKNSSEKSMPNIFSQQYSGTVSIQKNDSEYAIDVRSGSFFESIEKLFSLSKNDFCNLIGSDRLVTRVVFSTNSLTQALNMLCSQANASYTFHENTYIIYGNENAANTLISANSYWKTISLKFITSENYVLLFKKRFADIDILTLSNNMVQVELTSEHENEVVSFTEICDVQNTNHLIELQYITSDKFIKHLPPGIHEEQFTDLGTGYSLLFSGSDASHHELKKILKLLDKPATIIGYDLLVLQVQESESVNWKPTFSADRVSIGDNTGISGHLGSVFALNLDVVAAFGYTFAAELQAALGENRAKVYVDTKLQGISGSPIHFQNTNTFRYQDTAIDPDTGKPVYSGITREIIAGFVLDIEGWVSGDGMVTTKVTASLSRRGADISESGNPPPTSEKIVTTEVRGKSGEPIVLSGLVQNDSSFVQEATPGISKIPIIGWLFKSHQASEENTEMIIYLVPHVQNPPKEDNDDAL